MQQSLKSTIDSLVDGDKIIISGDGTAGNNIYCDMRQDEFINVKLTPRKSRRASVSRRGYPIVDPQNKLNDVPAVDMAEADASFFQKSKRAVFGLSLAAKIVIVLAVLAFIWMFCVSWSRGSTIASQNKIMNAIRKKWPEASSKEPLDKLVSEKLKAQTVRLDRMEEVLQANEKNLQANKKHLQANTQTYKEFKVLQRDVIQQESLSALKAYNAIRELQLRLNKHRVKANQERIQVLPEMAAPGPDQTTYLETIKKGISSAWSTIKEATSSAITKVKGVATCGGNTPTPARCSRCNDTGTFQVKVNGKERVVTCSCGDSSSLAD